MKKIITALVIAAFAASLGGCANMGPQEQVGAVTGGVAGGILGSTLFKGQAKAIGVGAGAVIGTMVGSSIGRAMDRQDQANAHGAYTQIQNGNIAVGQEASWVNNRTQTTFTVSPTRRYTRGNVECVRVRTKIIRRYAYGKTKRVIRVKTICRRFGSRVWHQV